MKHYEGKLGIFDYDENVWRITGGIIPESLRLQSDYKGKISLPKGVKSCHRMFFHHNLTKCWFEDFDTSGVEDMSGMFDGCKIPKGFSLGDKFDTSNVKNMKEMFRCCNMSEAEGFTLGDKFDTSNVTDMHEMFFDCRMPKGFSLGDKFDTSNVEDMSDMFVNGKISEGFTLGDKFDTSNVENLENIFKNCNLDSKELESILGSSKKVTSLSNALNQEVKNNDDIIKKIRRIADKSERLFPDVFPTEEDNITEKLIKEKSNLYIRYIRGNVFYSGPYRELYNQNMLDESIEEYGLDEDDLQSYVKIDNINSIASNIDIDENKDMYLTVYRGYYIVFNNKSVKEDSHIFDDYCAEVVNMKLVVNTFIKANLPESIPEVSEWSDIYDELFSELIDFVAKGRLAKGEKDAFKSLVLEVEKKVKSKEYYEELTDFGWDTVFNKKDLIDILKACLKGLSRVDKLFNIHEDEFGSVYAWTLSIDNFKELSQKESLYFESLLYCDDSEEHVCAGCLCYDSSKRELQIRYPIGY